MTPNASVVVPQRRNAFIETSASKRIDPSISTVKRGNKNDRSVSFANSHTQLPHIHFKNLSNSELRNAWWTYQEMQFIKKSATLTLRRIKKQDKESIAEEKEEKEEDQAEEQDSERGLELHMDRQSDFRRSRGREAVMKAQSMWRHLETPNPEMIAQVYRMVTSESRSFARQMGLSDYATAQLLAT
jgi:hypothetical protein